MKNNILHAAGRGHEIAGFLSAAPEFTVCPCFSPSAQDKNGVIAAATSGNAGVVPPRPPRLCDATVLELDGRGAILRISLNAPRLTALQLGAAVLVAGFAVLPQPAAAQTGFPSQPLKLIIPLAAGGVGDTTARLVGEKMGEKLGQRVVIENVPGPGGNAAARAALQPPADGHTMIMLTNGTAIGATLLKTMSYSPVTDFAAVAKLAQFEFFFATRGDGPHKTLADLIKTAKAQPGKLNVGTTTTGSTQHLTALLLKSSAGIEFQWVAFKTTPDLLIAVIRGDIDITVEGWSALKGNSDDGKIRVLSASSAQRSPSVPSIPGVKDAGGGDMDVVAWNGLFVKAGTPPAIIAALNKAVAEAQRDETLKKRLHELGISSETGTPEQMGNLLKSEIARWAKVIEANKLAQQ